MYFRLMGYFIEYPSILFSLGTKEGGQEHWMLVYVLLLEIEKLFSI